MTMPSSAPATLPLFVHEIIEAQAQSTPDNVALVHEGGQMTYSELLARSNQLAHYLRKRGVGPDVRVGVCLERSPELVVGILGILKAGGACVPLEPTYPSEQLALMIQETRPVLLLTQSRLRGAPPRRQPTRNLPGQGLGVRRPGTCRWSAGSPYLCQPADHRLHFGIDRQTQGRSVPAQPSRAGRLEPGDVPAQSRGPAPAENNDRLHSSAARAFLAAAGRRRACHRRSQRPSGSRRPGPADGPAPDHVPFGRSLAAAAAAGGRGAVGLHVPAPRCLLWGTLAGRPGRTLLPAAPGGADCHLRHHGSSHADVSALSPGRPATAGQPRLAAGEQGGLRPGRAAATRAGRPAR